MSPVPLPWSHPTARPPTAGAHGTPGGLDATVETVEELGSDAFLYCTVPGVEGVEGFVVARAEGLSGTRAGDTISLIPDHGVVHLFDTSTGLRLTSPK